MVINSTCLLMNRSFCIHETTALALRMLRNLLRDIAPYRVLILLHPRSSCVLLFNFCMADFLLLAISTGDS